MIGEPLDEDRGVVHLHFVPKIFRHIEFAFCGNFILSGVKKNERSKGAFRSVYEFKVGLGKIFRCYIDLSY